MENDEELKNETNDEKSEIIMENYDVQDVTETSRGGLSKAVIGFMGAIVATIAGIIFVKRRKKKKYIDIPLKEKVEETKVEETKNDETK